jgi:hypothetical protein
MKTASSGNNANTFVSRLTIASIAGAIAMTLLGLAAAPDLRAETPPDHIKAAGAILLTTDLLDKMDKFIKSASTDDAAKVELATANKDPSISPETWGDVISAKCPKTVEILKAAGLTPNEFAKAIYAIMVVGISEDLAKSADKTVQANAVLVAANKERADALFTAFLMLGEP